MSIPLTLLVLHFVGDFLLQSDWMALNKSKTSLTGLKALTCHCLVYSSVFAYYGAGFATITFALHVLVDAITSRITSRLWFIDFLKWHDQNEPDDYDAQRFEGRLHSLRRHWFFVVIGLDQLIHFGCLAWTLRLVTP